MNVFLLAAGQGTRLRPFTETLPKPAIPFLTIPLAAYSLNLIKELSYNKLIVNTFHLPMEVHKLFSQTLPNSKVSLHFSDEKDFIRGSGGALKFAEKAIDADTIMLLNSDEVTIPHQAGVLTKALQEHESSDSIATLIVTEHTEVGSKFGGVWVDENNNIMGFGKTKVENSHRGYHFIGTQFLNRRILDFIPENCESNILYDGVQAALNKGFKAKVFPIACTWFETGNPQDFFHAQECCLNEILNNTPVGIYLSEAINNFALEKTEYIQTPSAKIIKASSATIDDSAKLQGTICLGAKAVIEKNCHLTQVNINSDVVLPANTHAQQAMFLK